MILSWILILLLPHPCFSKNIYTSSDKVLICGVCQNIESSAKHSIKSIETLGKRFGDYRVILYENNSSDRTVKIFQSWAAKNFRVKFITEKIKAKDLAKSRTERIAHARNQVLLEAKKEEYRDFKYFVLVDLDFQKGWPIDEIVKTVLNQEIEWDSVSANGVLPDGRYYDLYAFRDWNFVLNHEILGFGKSIDMILDTQKWHPVYSAFGGLAIYKTETITQFNYCGTVTEELENYYKNIFIKMGKHHPEVKKYLKLNHLDLDFPLNHLTISFKKNSPKEHPRKFLPITCCEHLTLHAAMALKGYGKFFINPKMKMYYLP